MLRRDCTTAADSLRQRVDERPSSCRQCPSPTILRLLVIAALSGLAVTADGGVDGSGPFRSRGRSSGNLVGGYLAAIERHHRRFSRTHVDVLFRKLGDDFNADLMSVAKPSPNLTSTVSISSSSSSSSWLLLSVADPEFGKV